MKDCGDHFYIRDDVEIESMGGDKIAASFFYPLEKGEVEGFGDDFFAKHDFQKKRDLNLMPCLVYLHSQGGSRIEGNFLIEFCAKHKFALCLFDFLGSGLSGGEYVSLGIFERYQIESVVNQMRKWHNIGAIGIWGRSMGAVTGVLFTQRNSFQTVCLVLDSPFTSVKEMVQEVAYEHYKIPSFLVSMGIGIINTSIKKRIGVDIFKLAPIKQGKFCAAPAIFISGKEDGLVTSKKVKSFCDLYNSEKENKVKKFYLESGGNHSDQREKEIIETSFEFIEREFIKYKSFCIGAEEDMKPVHGIKISIRNKKLKLLELWTKNEKNVKRRKKGKDQSPSKKRNQRNNSSHKKKIQKENSKERMNKINTEPLPSLSMPPMPPNPHGLAPHEMKPKPKELTNQRLQLLSNSARPKKKPDNGKYAYGYRPGDSQDTRSTDRRLKFRHGGGRLNARQRNLIRNPHNSSGNILSPEFLADIRSSRFDQTESTVDPYKQQKIMQEAELDDTLILDDDEIIDGDYETLNDGNDSILMELNELDKYLKGVSNNLKKSQADVRRASPPKLNLMPGTGLDEQQVYSGQNHQIPNFQKKNSYGGGLNLVNNRHNSGFRKNQRYPQQQQNMLRGSQMQMQPLQHTQQNMVRGSQMQPLQQQNMVRGSQMQPLQQKQNLLKGSQMTAYGLLANPNQPYQNQNQITPFSHTNSSNNLRGRRRSRNKKGSVNRQNSMNRQLSSRRRGNRPPGPKLKTEKIGYSAMQRRGFANQQMATGPINDYGFIPKNQNNFAMTENLNSHRGNRRKIF